jgi:hypothetical protein
MPFFPDRASAAGRLRPGRTRRTVIEPMLPALLRGVIFLLALAAPFIAALLAN